MRSSLLFVVLMALLASGPVAVADEPVVRITPDKPITRAITPRDLPATKGTKAPSPSVSGNWWSMVGSLAIVLAVIVGLAGLLRMQLPGARGLLPRDVLYDLGRRPLDARSAVHLLRCGARILVVGNSPQGLQTLSEITDPIEVDYLTGLCKSQTNGPSKATFQSSLRKFLGLQTADAAFETPSEDEPEEKDDSGSPDVASQRLKDRLRQTLSGGPRAAEVMNG